MRGRRSADHGATLPRPREFTDPPLTLAKGATVPLTLVFKDAQGAESKVELQVPVSAQAPGAAGGHGMGMKH